MTDARTARSFQNGLSCGKRAVPAASCRKRVMGIEPTYPAWKAGVLPLNYTRRYGNRGDRIRTCDLLVPNQAL